MKRSTYKLTLPELLLVTGRKEGGHDVARRIVFSLVGPGGTRVASPLFFNVANTWQGKLLPSKESNFRRRTTIL